MKRLLTIFALTCALSVSVLAGQIPTVGTPQPPPPVTTNTTSPGDILSVPGEIPSGDSAEQISDAALSVLLTLFGLLSV